VFGRGGPCRGGGDGDSVGTTGEERWIAGRWSLGASFARACALRRAAMSAEQNKASAEAAYKAFSEGDAAGAMANMDDGVVWKVGGDHALTGTYHGKQEIGELWAKLAEKSVGTEPHDYVADGDKVVVLTTAGLDGESVEAADVLTFNGEGKLIEFEQLGDTSIGNRVFAR
jgi:ketosteroid isomerase-like protein